MPTSPRPPFLERLLSELPSLLRRARRLTRSEADAEDLVQQTVVRAMERHGDLRDEQKLRAWLLRVQRSVHLNSNRGLRVRLEVIDGGRAQADPPRELHGDLERELLERSFEDGVTAALSELPPTWRDALLLREVEELTYEEIAQVQGCPVGTVRSRLSRARLSILEKLSQNKEEDRHVRVRSRMVR